MKEQLRQFLSRRQKQRILDSSRLPAAVLIPIFLKHGDYHVLFTIRTEQVKTHKGQISFPGGVYEKRDGTLLDTALRETEEEIGLRPGDVEVVGELDDQISVASNYTIAPFAGFFPWPYNFRRNEREVAEILQIPVAALLNKKSRRDADANYPGNTYHYRRNIIWGATARIVNQLVSILEQLESAK